MKHVDLLCVRECLCDSMTSVNLLKSHKVIYGPTAHVASEILQYLLEVIDAELGHPRSDVHPNDWLPGVHAN